jgi:O-antigen/teichoic acid export membrane protein
LSSYLNTIKDTSINAIARVLLIPITFLTLPILTTNLSIIDYGLWGLIFTTNNLTMPFTGLGLPSALSRYGPSYENNKFKSSFSSLFIFKTITTSIVSLVILLFSNQISSMFFENRIELVRLISLFIFISTFEPLFTRVLRIKRKIKTVSIYNLSVGYTTILLYLFFFSYSSNIESLFEIFIIYKSLSVLTIAFFCKDFISILSFDLAVLKKFYKYGIHTLVSSISFWYINLSDRFIMASLIGSYSLGIYTASYQIGTIPRIFSGIITYILLIALSKLYDEGKINEVRNHLSISLLIFLSLSILFCFGAILFSREILSLLTNEEISINGWKTTVIVSFAHLFLGVSTIFNYSLLLTKKVKLLSIIWSIALIINIALNFILVPIIGIEGAALATMLSYFLVMIIIIKKSRTLLKFDIKTFQIFKIILVGFSMLLFDKIIFTLVTELFIFRIILNIIFMTLFYYYMQILNIKKLKDILIK